MTVTPKQIAVAIVEHDGRLLVGVRAEGSVLAGHHEFPGGKIERGESAAEAAVRECREETGINVTVVRELDWIRHQYEYGSVELHFFECRVVGQTTRPRPPFKWVDRDELASLAWPLANEALIARLCRNVTPSEN